MAKETVLELNEIQKSWETILEVLSGNTNITPKEFKISLKIIQTLIDTTRTE